MTPGPSPPGVDVRHDLRPGDLGRIVERHGTIYSHECGYESIFLWTVSALAAAARLYRAAGFVKVEEKEGAWGALVTEEKYLLRFA